MPPRFRWREADIYVPLKVTLDPNLYYGALLKIRPGVSVAQANAELQPILERFAQTLAGPVSGYGRSWSTRISRSPKLLANRRRLADS
jgi:hypothetical protein